jgi:DNA-binding MarR family transcriptional regulator
MHMQGEGVVGDNLAEAPPAPVSASDGVMIGGIDVRDVAGCTCLKLRRAARMATQVFDDRLQRAGLTIGQFGIMAEVYGSSLSRPPLTMKALSNAIGMDPTTLNRTLKPLEASGFVSVAPDPRDGRARCVQLTAAGRERLAQAMPLWRAAGDEVRRTAGHETMLALGGLLTLLGEKMRGPE